MMRNEESLPEHSELRAGGVVIGHTTAAPLAVVIHRSKYDDWSFPKGKIDPGETAEQAALREVREETGLQCRIQHYLGLYTNGLTDGTNRPTHYWIMTVTHAGQFTPGEEIDDLRWIELRTADSLLTHQRDRDLATAALPTLRLMR